MNESSGHVTVHLPLTIGESVHVLRERAGWSQEELAKRAGVSRNTVAAIEQGKANPTIGALSSICDALGFWLHVALAEVKPDVVDERKD